MPLTTYTSGEVLTASSLNANFSFAAANGMVWVGGATPSAAATVTVDNVFTSTYTHYLITFNFTGGTTEDLRLQFRYGSTTQAASYYSAMNTADYGGTAGVVSINNGAYIPLSLDMLKITGQLFVSNVGVSSTGAMITGQIMNSQDARCSSGGALVNSTQTYTGFIFTNSAAGSIFTGKVNVYGLVNA